MVFNPFTFYCTYYTSFFGQLSSVHSKINFKYLLFNQQSFQMIL